LLTTVSFFSLISFSRLTRSEYINRLRQHITLRRRERADSHLDRSSYWQSVCTQRQSDKRKLQAELLALQRENDTLRAQLQGSETAGPRGAKSAKRKEGAISATDRVAKSRKVTTIPASDAGGQDQSEEMFEPLLGDEHGTSAYLL